MPVSRRPHTYASATLIGLALAVVTAACTGAEEGRRDGAGGQATPAVATLRLVLDHRISGEPLQMAAPQRTRYGHQVNFQQLGYWLGQVELHAQGSGEVVLLSGNYRRVSLEQGHRVSLDYRVPPGTYETVRFGMGVAPQHNGAAGIELGDLEADSTTSRSGEAGFDFFSATGEYAQGDDSGAFSMFIGGDSLYRTLTAQLGSPLEVSADGLGELPLEVQVGRVFAGLYLPDISEYHGGPVGSTESRVATNYSRMFFLRTPDGLEPMDPEAPTLAEAGGLATVLDTRPPVLVAPIVRLGPDEGGERVGDLHCGVLDEAPMVGCVRPFAGDAVVEAEQDASLGFVVRGGAPVFATLDGVVTAVRFIEHSHFTHSDLFVVEIRPTVDSAFVVEHRRVNSPQVQEGDVVSAGEELGTAGDYLSASHGAVDLAVVRSQQTTQRLCPLRYADEPLAQQLGEALAAHNARFAAASADTLCAAVSVLCEGPACGGGATTTEGDVESGRAIYGQACASCHGRTAEGNIGPPVCSACGCSACDAHDPLAARIALDMPPEGRCKEACADDVAAFLLHALNTP